MLLRAIAVAVRSSEINTRSHDRRHAGIAAWQRAAAEARTAHTARLPTLRQLDIRTRADLFSSHPPAGMRARMVSTWPAMAATVVLTTHESAAIDAELAKHYDRAGRELVHHG